VKLHSDSRHLRQFQIFSFQFAIKKFDLKTPVREDDEFSKLCE
jgi:phosphotransferase system  glucose/maltose/N-acetylglucosamine-specific IIC component